MIVLSGAHLVLPDRMLTPGTLVLDGDRIVEVRAGASGAPVDHHYIVPGFIDVHVHGVEGFDTLDEGNPVAAMAARLPRYGVTAFCPTTVACAPDALGRVLRQVRLARNTPAARAARVLPAHLESNFISAEFRGAQPLACLRSPRAALDGGSPSPHGNDPFSASELLTEIERAGADVGIVTLAPELEGSLDLIRWIRSHGLRVSLGHSGATFETGLEAIAAGARHATHLFNRMPPLGHRAPGLAGAILQSEAIAAEVICDGYHVHPAIARMAVAAKGPSRIMAITDGTAVSGLLAGTRAMLGGQPITANQSAAFLSDGTLAGSALTMDRAFQTLVGKMKLSIVDAATVCSMTAARELGLAGHGVLARDAIADVVILDDNLSVVQTYVAGQLVYSRDRPTLVEDGL
ncbi:MAG TPA: N-acetylglucosamine-6-phosphate deacetylase [Vicinamibacterales bacterium]